MAVPAARARARVPADMEGTTAMIVIVEKPFTGPAHWAKSYLGSTVLTPQGRGKVQEAVVNANKQTVTLHCWVEPKTAKEKT